MRPDARYSPWAPWLRGPGGTWARAKLPAAALEVWTWKITLLSAVHPRSATAKAAKLMEYIFKKIVVPTKVHAFSMSKKHPPPVQPYGIVAGLHTQGQ